MKAHVSCRPAGPGNRRQSFVVFVDGECIGTVERINGAWRAKSTGGPVATGKTKTAAVSAMLALRAAT